MVSDAAWFPSISQLELRVDGVNAMRCHRDALFMIVRASTRRVSARRRFRDNVRATQEQITKNQQQHLEGAYLRVDSS